MNKKISLILLAALGFCSCEERFELNDVGGQPRMYVECYAGISDTTFIQLYKAMPVNANASDGRDYTLKRLSLTVGGAPAEINPVNDTLIVGGDSIPPAKGLFWTDTPIPAGSRLRMEVETEETAPVSAETTIPAKQSFSVTTSLEGGSLFPYLQFKLKFSSKVSPDDRFGVCIKQHTVLHYDDGSEDYEYTMSSAPTMINGEITMEQSLPVFGYPETFYFGMCSGEDIADGELNAILMYDPMEDSWQESRYDDDGNELEPVNITRKTELRIQVLRFSDESYGYLNSLYKREGNLLSMLGFTPPSVAYTNISGGYGVLGGLSLAESPWYDMQVLIGD